MARKNWLSEDQESTVIDDYAKGLDSFVDAMADGVIDEKELNAQEERVIELMKKVEPKLDDDTHAAITELLVELSAFNVMQMLNEMYAARPASAWRP